MNNKKLIVGLIGGPGTGKSTNSAYIFSVLKKKGINIEYVPEFAKELVFEKRFQTLQNQLYVFGKQYKKITTPLEDVDIVITDSPILISAIHKPEELSDVFNKLVMEIFNLHNNAIYLLKRIYNYQQVGRIEDENGAKQTDDEIEKFLIENNIPYTTVTPDDEGIEFIIDDIIKKYNQL